MTRLVDDDLVDAFAVRGAPQDVGSMIVDRFAGVYDRVRVNTPYDLSHPVRDDLLDGLVAAAARNRPPEDPDDPSGPVDPDELAGAGD
jgi:hypothetical protein